MIFLVGCSGSMSDKQAITDSRSITNPEPPFIINPEPFLSTTPELLPNGNIGGYIHLPDGGAAYLETSNNGRTWSEPKVLYHGDNTNQNYLTAHAKGEDGRHHLFYLQYREGRKFLELHHRRSSEDGQSWEDSQLIAPNVFIGALFDAICLESGRIIVPFHYRVGERTPPTGSNVSTLIYSDDNGSTWTEIQSKLTVPCFDGYNGNNFGACEPRILLKEDKSIWMLIRTQTGFLYESTSSDDGSTWSDPQPSIFYSTNSPGTAIRLQDGRIVAFWNNCENTTPFDGHKVYTTRDALHAAISEDDGVTWRGFREVYLDHLRNMPPPPKGDRGTAYPRAVGTADGKILLISGQGEGKRVQILVDPEWLYQTTLESDFSDSLKNWSVFKRFMDEDGLVSRMPGCELLPHPSRKGAKVLHVRRPDDKRPDVAEWNFPLGRSGSVAISMMLQEGFAGGAIDLADRYFQPTDVAAISERVFNIPIHANGQISDSEMRLVPGQWYTLELQWNISQGLCKVIIDGKEVSDVNMNRKTHLGISYLLLRSTAQEMDQAGFLVERVSADISEPKTAPVSRLLEPMKPRIKL